MGIFFQMNFAWYYFNKKNPRKEKGKWQSFTVFPMNYDSNGNFSSIVVKLRTVLITCSTPFHWGYPQGIALSWFVITHKHFTDIPMVIKDLRFMRMRIFRCGSGLTGVKSPVPVEEEEDEMLS